MKPPDWSGASGDAWAQHWRSTDRALAPVGAALDAAIAAAAPPGAFRAFDVGCGPGTTALALAERRGDAHVIGCDVSAPLIAIARARAEDIANAEFLVGDAEAVVAAHAPFDLIFSRHGVMFFGDPARAFRGLRGAAAPGAHLVLSCFRAWDANPWASLLEAAAAGAPATPPESGPGAFAFADAEEVGDMLAQAGWAAAEATALDFDYVAGAGEDAVEQAVTFLTTIGPASRIIAELNGDARAAAVARLRDALRARLGDYRVVFAGAAWIWTAQAA
ncbi:class I SAM-dependent methyltransferase [Sphingomonas lutea]|uniref:Class I SAM-dependent methyltransferase n=1 Tax=Sphingomonas lutea TaxID=1045317 RepID=A0A7G9SF65_9SPHN|nr:class I SAM-dependent methyltransferase [Sphingomonas lutea]QNN66490.1 class I SAM-dependent methyltransferase [Sphingomonas lutea]